MYTQRPVPLDGMSIPQNYGGNAFRYPPIGGLEKATPPEEELPSHGEDSVDEHEPMVIANEETCDPQQKALRPAPLLGHHHGEEDLLLIGLFLLLAGDGVIGRGREKPQGDILLYLLLLLFCG